MRIGIFYGSTNGNTQMAAELIAKEFSGHEVEIFDVGRLKDAKKLLEFDLILLGSSTWGDGELQSDWEEFYPKLDEISLNGKKVALFGLGDQDGYGHEFVSALRILFDKARLLGAEIIGFWDVDGYEFEYSMAVVDNKFVGLALDEDNQSELTEPRIKKWCNQLKKELNL